MSMIELTTNTYGGVQMNFKNCTSPFPDKNGFFISASSCGSGKTTMILDIALKKWKDGILIVVPTKKEAEEIYTGLVNQKSAVTIGRTLVSLNCNNVKEMNDYRNNPDSLAKACVLIITSARMMIDPLELFMNFGMGGARKYVLIDEMINFFPPAFHIPKELYDIVTYTSTSRPKTSVRNKSVKVNGRNYYRHCYRNENLMRASYEMSSYRCFKENNQLSAYKMDVIFRHIVSKGTAPLEQNILVYSSSSTILLFDGTADCIFSPKDKRLLTLTGKRYSSDIEFVQLPLMLKRKNKENWKETDLIRYDSAFINKVAELTKTDKVLVVSWKTVEKFKSENNGDADEFETDFKKAYEFPEMIERCLVGQGAVKANLNIIYRGSGLDRGSNEFRDCSVIFFLGEWRIPDTITADINRYFNTKCSFDDYKLSLMVQTICRLRIRNHDGKSIKVFFSSDIDYNLMYKVQEYFKSNSPASCKISGVLKPCGKYEKDEKGFVLDLSRLFSYDKKIRNAVLTSSTYSFNISLADIFSLIPRDKRKRDRYDAFRKFLYGKGITMNIT